MAPFIPGISEVGLGELLEEARAAGAKSASYGMLRLPGPVKEVFEQRLREALPDRADKVLNRLRETSVQPGRSSPSTRGRGTGPYAEALAATFDGIVRRLGFPGSPPTRLGTFRRPDRPRPQLELF